MTKITPVDPVQNIYATDVGFALVAKQDMLFEGRTVTKLTYRDSHTLIWKIFQVALASLCTLMTLGLALCVQKGIIWKEVLEQFKDRFVYLKAPVQPSAQTVTPSCSNPLDAAQPTQTPAPLQQKKEAILKENPEYGNAVQAWEAAGVSLADQITRLEELKQYAFGTDKWVKYFGDVIGDVPLLPADIVEICAGKDHSKPSQNVKDTHVLVLVPEAVMVNGKPFEITLKSLGELVKAPKVGGNMTEYSLFEAKGHENTPVGKSHWVLMTKEVIPGSRNQSYYQQGEKVKEYSLQAKVPYSMPHAIDAAACCSLHFVSTGKRLFDFTSKDPDHWIHTRCQEQVDGIRPLTVGDPMPGEGLYIFDDDRNPIDYLGVVAVRQF